ncbi:hypothetical protein HPB50_015479 [Hyalomma asiaticum]|uniref:Uncharacterized protein n=1 Tax=Hyalomma asiaticum TaxID=266040 RepID=A0ACB7RIX9_HYAAI|nr:hypothetical protein HPB50_015479 [Hyalomma asiaticum]
MEANSNRRVCFMTLTWTALNQDNSPSKLQVSAMPQLGSEIVQNCLRRATLPVPLRPLNAKQRFMPSEFRALIKTEFIRASVQ